MVSFCGDARTTGNERRAGLLLAEGIPAPSVGRLTSPNRLCPRQGPTPPMTSADCARGGEMTIGSPRRGQIRSRRRTARATGGVTHRLYFLVRPIH
jgi:hypothetical protein